MLRIVAVAANQKIRAMRTIERVAGIDFPTAAVIERLLQASPAGPAATVFKRNRFAWQPTRQQGPRQRFQCRHIMPALLGDRGSLAFQLRLPGPGQPRITGTQGAVALTQGAVITPPVFVERMFHVEHTPIEKAAPYLRAIEQEPLAFGVDDLQG